MTIDEARKVLKDAGLFVETAKEKAEREQVQEALVAVRSLGYAVVRDVNSEYYSDGSRRALSTE